ncbi:TnsA-like heteromeric transposase endonuclease subunit [Nocardia wallacei]|uniref:TnsA-like heteromeric transposase endonuclease subunit n=1 Tax=Nocardia wallacei TaxID=480035 RepID=UPI002454E932|nr:TnsA-like heteromeric transposase endonuclease subunit [Nocardia wallacei]
MGVPGSQRSVGVDAVEVAFRRADGSELVQPLEAVGAEVLGGAAPWRRFRWYHDQKHYSGSYWSATESGHVVYESRLELARLLFADFDCSVRRIVAQPFLLRAECGGKVRRHVPDFLLFTGSGPVVVDVKPAARLQNPKVAFTFGWTEQVVTARGWRYEVWIEPEPVELGNVGFLAGYRRAWLFEPDVLDGVRGSVTSGMTIAEVLASISTLPRAVVRAGLLHLLWRQEFVVDMSTRLRSGSILQAA